MPKLKKLLTYLNSLAGQYQHLVRFGLVGTMNTTVDFVVFSVFQYFLGGPVLSQTLGHGAGMVNSFLLNKLWTFENKNPRRKIGRQVLEFTVINLVSLSATTLGLMMLTETMHVNVYLAKALTLFLAQFINFSGYRLVVFRPT